MDALPEELKALIASFTKGEECTLGLASKIYNSNDDFLEAFAKTMGFPAKNNNVTWNRHVTWWCNALNNPLTTFNNYVQKGDIDGAVLLLKYTVLDRRKYDVFQEVMDGREDQLEHFIREFAEQRGRDNNTALMLALESHDREMALKLFELYPDAASVVDNKGRTALTFALESHDREMADKLLECMDREAWSTPWRTALMVFLGSAIDGTDLLDEYFST